MLFPVEGGDKYEVSEGVKGVEMLDGNMNSIFIELPNETNREIEIPNGIHYIKAVN